MSVAERDGTGRESRIQILERADTGHAVEIAVLKQGLESIRQDLKGLHDGQNEIVRLLRRDV